MLFLRVDGSTKEMDDKWEGSCPPLTVAFQECHEGVVNIPVALWGIVV